MNSSFTSHQHLGHTETRHWFKVSCERPENGGIGPATPELVLRGKIKNVSNQITVDIPWLQHWWLVYHGFFNSFLSPLVNPIVKFRVFFFFYIENGISCVFIKIASLSQF